MPSRSRSKARNLSSFSFFSPVRFLLLLTFFHKYKSGEVLKYFPLKGNQLLNVSLDFANT